MIVYLIFISSLVS